MAIRFSHSDHASEQRKRHQAEQASTSARSHSSAEDATSQVARDEAHSHDALAQAAAAEKAAAASRAIHSVAEKKRAASLDKPLDKHASNTSFSATRSRISVAASSVSPKNASRTAIMEPEPRSAAFASLTANVSKLKTTAEVRAARATGREVYPTGLTKAEKRLAPNIDQTRIARRQEEKVEDKVKREQTYSTGATEGLESSHPSSFIARKRSYESPTLPTPAQQSRPSQQVRVANPELSRPPVDLRRNSFIEDDRQRLIQKPTEASVDESGHPRAAIFQAAQRWTAKSEAFARDEVKSHHDRGRDPFWQEPKGTEPQKIEQAKANIGKAMSRSTQISYAIDSFGEEVMKFRMSLPGQAVGPGIKNLGPGVMFSKSGLAHLMDQERTPEQKAAADARNQERRARREARKINVESPGASVGTSVETSLTGAKK